MFFTNKKIVNAKKEMARALLTGQMSSIENGMAYIINVNCNASTANIIKEGIIVALKDRCLKRTVIVLVHNEGTQKIEFEVKQSGKKLVNR